MVATRQDLRPHDFTDVSLLFFTGSYDYFLLVNGLALYFVLDIVYNRLFWKRCGKDRAAGIAEL